MCVCCSTCGGVSELNQSEFTFGIFYLYFTVGSDQILQTILDQYLFFFWIRRAFRSQFKETSVFFEVYFQDNWNNCVVAFKCCKI